MIKILSLLLFGATLIQNSSCIFGNLSVKVSKTVKEIVTKWENKELDLNVGCAQQLIQLLKNLISLDDGLWAYKMIDATGKFPSGLAEGNIVVMGSFDECLKVKSEKKNVTGNYCSITLDIGDSLSKVEQKQNRLLEQYKKFLKNQEVDSESQQIGSLPLYGICIPNKCSAEDVNNAIQLVTRIIPLSIRCQTKEEINPSLDTGAIITIVFLGFVVFLMVSSTLIDYIYQGKGIKAHPILLSFSAIKNGQKLFRIGSSQGDLACLHGIRFLSMCWVMLGHIFITSIMSPYVNLLEFVRHLQKVDSMLYLTIPHAVDTFFVLSGLLVAYNFMKKRKIGEQFNIFKYYVHRYLRLTPAYAAVILCSIYLLKYLGSGPVYNVIDPLAAKLCRDHWWKALLYFQNYIKNSATLCVVQSWNLSVDYQLYLISPILLFCLYKRPKFGSFLTVLAITGCMIASFIITHEKRIGALALNLSTSMTAFMREYYVKTHTRASTWLIGAWLGYVLGRIKFYDDKSYLRIPRVLILSIWLVVLALIPVCIFGFHDVLMSQDYDVMANSLYNTFVRPIWALCVSWVIFTCSIGYGGIINDFLSWPIFGLLSKFTYSMYLLHLTILYIMTLSRKIPAYFSIPGVIFQFCNLFPVTFIVSVFWILAFEMPILVIEPYIFGSGGKSSKKNQISNETTSNNVDIETPETTK